MAGLFIFSWRNGIMFCWRFQTVVTLLILGLLPATGVRAAQDDATSATLPFMRGINYCSYWNNDYLNEYSPRSIQKIRETGNNWISILVTWYQADEKAATIYQDANRTPSDAAVEKAIADARNQGLKISLKPHIDLDNGNWRAGIGAKDYVSDADFDAFFTAWFASYRTFIHHYADMARKHNVEMLVIGTEYNSIMERDNGKTMPFWIAYIDDIRKAYPGILTYAADWSEWKDASAPGQKMFWKDFWHALDYIGIDAYYPLSPADTATPDALIQGWQEPLAILEQISAVYGRPVIFTEIGYKSMEKCYLSPGDYQLDYPVSEECQRDCFQAAYRALAGKDWLAGLFWWGWKPFLRSDMANPENPSWVTDKYNDYLKDYTPEGKLAETILRTENAVSGNRWSCR